MRKFLLILIGGLTLVALAASAVAWNEVKQLSPSELNRRITDAVKAETGLDLISGRLRMSVSYHVIVTLESARLLSGNETVARFGQIRLICGYRTLLFHRGLPFLAVSLDRPTVVLPVESVTPGPMPILDENSVRDLRRLLVRLSNITRQVVMSTATVEDREGHVLFDEAAVRASHSRTAGAWRMRMEGLFRGVALPSFKVGASLTLAPEIDGPEIPFARGSLWFWDAQLQDLATRGMKLGGVVQGNLTFLIRTDGTVRGQALTRVNGFQFAGPLVAGPIDVDDLALSARLTHSSTGLELSHFQMSAGGHELISGYASVAPIPPDNLRIRLHVAPLSLRAEQVKSMLRRFRGLPPWVSDYAQMVSVGKIGLDELSTDTTLKELEAPSAKILLEQTELKAALDGVALSAPDLPALAGLGGKLQFAGGLVRLTQSHGSWGASSLSDISLSADLGHPSPSVPYQAKVSGNFDLAELFAALRPRLTPSAADPLRRIHNLHGNTSAEIELHGDLARFDGADPLQSYLAVLHPHSVAMAVANVPSEIKLYGGAVIISPREIIIDKLDLTPGHGSIKASGRIVKDGAGAWEVTNLSLAMRQISAQEWLPKLIAMETMDVHAPASGNLAVTRVKNGAGRYQVDGDLTLDAGQIKFAFLRSPLVLTGPAIVTLKGEGGILSIKSATLEGSPMQMTLSIADVEKPVIRIDAKADRLDLEAITAVRLPWTPKTPIKIDNTPFEGHIEARQASLSRLSMTDLKASFRRNAENWRVFDINGDAMGGHFIMDLTGRRRDDWVHIISRADDIDVVALQGLGNNRTVVTGRLSSDADLWADTDDDFFSTLTGSLSTKIQDGLLLKFKLLSRMLSLVDVSEWLKADIPDPRVKGVPFKTISARFSGEQGNFETSDFMLDGPVMKITAAGKVNVDQSAMNMMIGMRPFQLLDTVFNKIPLIGTRLAQSQSGIVAAYFHVQGPVSDPTVVPAPITSISHLLIKTLAIPINLLVPETIR